MPDLVFGTGGRFGRLTYTTASRLVHSALDHGVVHFDTGYEYSSRRSQPLLFKILGSTHKLSNSKVHVSTKFFPPQKAGQLTESVDRSILQLSGRDYIDTIFLWGPSLSDLNRDFLFPELAALKNSGKIKSWGINSHCYTTIAGIADSLFPIPLDHIMLDYNLLQQNRLELIKSFSANCVQVWAGTVLCQGFLSQSLPEMFFRTRSISYLSRALLQPQTRRFLRPAKIFREHFKFLSRDDAQSLPLSFVASNSLVSKIPVGMLSLSSIKSNVSILANPSSPSLIEDAASWAYRYCQV